MEIRNSLNEIENKIKRILFLNDNLRILAAREEYDSLQNILETSTDFLETERNEINSLQEKYKEIFNQIILRSNEIKEIIKDTSESLDGWILGSEIFGISTYYHVEDDGFLSLRMEGVQDIPIFEQLAVLYEVALFNQWMPFCSQSDLLQQLSIGELIWYAKISTPLAVRDMVVHVYAVDCTIENECVAFAGKSYDPSEHPNSNAQVPPEPSVWSGYRINVQKMCGVMNIISPTTAKTVIITKMDIKLSLPQTVINFIMKNIAGMFLYLLQRQTLQAASDPNSIHAITIRQKTDFYVDFMLANVRAFCQHKGWDQVTVSVLGDLGVPIEGTDYTKPNLY